MKLLKTNIIIIHCVLLLNVCEGKAEIPDSLTRGIIINPALVFWGEISLAYEQQIKKKQRSLVGTIGYIYRDFVFMPYVAGTYIGNVKETIFMAANGLVFRSALRFYKKYSLNYGWYHGPLLMYKYVKLKPTVVKYDFTPPH